MQEPFTYRDINEVGLVECSEMIVRLTERMQGESDVRFEISNALRSRYVKRRDHLLSIYK